ncbi:WD repeat- and FYVE domain-containing protein 4 [Varanus komodoensis]|nr:WD repeat- and FYVE domain-containing protein 4 [Varanus komodoensis]
METVLELKAEEDSPEENAGQNHALANKGPVVAVPTQSVKPGKGQDPCLDPSLLWETLGRQLLEYEEMAALQSPEEQRRRLLDLLPVFLKAWEQSAGEISFLNAQLLASETAKLLVKEIQKNLNRKPAEAARLAVQRFLQQETGEAADGPVLFRSVYLLSLGHLEPGVRCSIIKSGLPVLLLQCLHLFFVSPLDEAGGSGGKTQDERQTQDLFVQVQANHPSREHQCIKSGDKFSHGCCYVLSSHIPTYGGPVNERLPKSPAQTALPSSCKLRAGASLMESIPLIAGLPPLLPPWTPFATLEAIFQSPEADVLCQVYRFLQLFFGCQTMLNICAEEPAVDELLLAADLRSLIISVTSLWDQSSPSWKCPTSQVLRTISKAQSKNIISYLQATDCIKVSIQNLSTLAESLPPCEGQSNPGCEGSLRENNAEIGAVVLSTGNRVRNLKAFQVLESLFQKSINPELCQYILQALKSIWTWDSMNFFLLEWSLQPISQFVSLIPHKPPLVQKDFFQLVESVVWDLSYIPHEILKEIQCLIKENTDPLSTSAALLCLHSIAQKDQLFKDLFRDSGLLGMLLAQLRKEAKILRKKGGTPAVSQDQRMEKELVNTMLQMVVALVVGSVRNTVVFRDYGMVPYIKIFIDDDLFRSHTLTILEQLSVINPEEYMSIIVGNLCSSTPGELHFKLDLLKGSAESLLVRGINKPARMTPWEPLAASWASEKLPSHLATF